jgi:hypothetical protein
MKSVSWIQESEHHDLVTSGVKRAREQRADLAAATWNDDLHGLIYRNPGVWLRRARERA